MKTLKYYEQDLLTVVYNMLVCMESETDDIPRYMKKADAPAPFKPDDLFDGLSNAIEICEKYNKK